MNYVQKKRLLKLADFLDKLPRKKFKFTEVVSGKETPNKTLTCGSQACAIGWCPVVFPRLTEYVGVSSYTGMNDYIVVKMKGMNFDGGSLDSVTHIGEELFGLSDPESYALFVPDHPQAWILDLKPLGETATPKQVAKNIRKFVAIKTKKAKK